MVSRLTRLRQSTMNTKTRRREMRYCRFAVSVLLISFVSVAFVGSETHKSDVQKSEAQKSFDQLKTLAGTWKGPVTLTPAHPEWDDKPMWVSLRLTSRGNALVHEIKQPGTPDDPTQDDPITMLYLDGGRLYLTHYCDAGNRPRMVARTSPDGKTVEFDFVDVAGGTQHGHMHHAVFTVIDGDHHSEDWTY